MTSQEALLIISQHAGLKSAKEIAILCGKSYESVRGIAKRANVSLAVHPSYKKHEDDFIRDNIDTLSYEDMSKIISGALGLNYKRSTDSIRHRAATLGIAGQSQHKSPVHSKLITPMFGTEWSPEEDHVLKSVKTGELTYVDVASHLGRTIESCKARIKQIREQEQRQKERNDYIISIVFD